VLLGQGSRPRRGTVLFFIISKDFCGSLQVIRASMFGAIAETLLFLVVLEAVRWR
jgi:hypothetical protein